MKLNRIYTPENVLYLEFDVVRVLFLRKSRGLRHKGIIPTSLGGFGGFR